MKRLLMIVPIAALAFAGFAPAQAQEVSETPDDPTCTPNHVTGDPCQSPRVDGRNDSVGCQIEVWVGRAICEGIVPQDGSPTISTFNYVVRAWNDGSAPASVTIRVIDEATGEVLLEDSSDKTFTVQTPVGEATRATVACGCSIPGEPESVRLEVEGTHAQKGAATAGLAFGFWNAELAGFGLPPVPNNHVLVLRVD